MESFSKFGGLLIVSNERQVVEYHFIAYTQNKREQEGLQINKTEKNAVITSLADGLDNHIVDLNRCNRVGR